MNEVMSDRELILSSCKSLKLGGIRSAIESAVTQASQENWSYDKLVATLLEKESEHREELRRKAQVRRAGFPQLLYLENLKRNELPKDMAVALPELETLDFIKEGQNVIMYGNPGTGKTHCAIGLGIKACLAGYTVLYTSIPHLLTEIRECESQRRLGRLQSKFKKYDLVIGDEFGYKSFDKAAAEALFNHISLRAGIKSMIITTNLGFDHWNEIFTDKIIASAIVDRLTFKSYIIDMNGISFRLKATKEWMDERKKRQNKEK